MLDKIKCKFRLGEIYYHYNDFVKSKEMFSFVSDHGGTTCYVKMANDYLQQMPQEEIAVENV